MKRKAYNVDDPIEKVSFELLPDELWICILEYLQLRDLGILESVSKRIKGLCQSSNHWISVKKLSGTPNIGKVNSLLKKIEKIRKTTTLKLNTNFPNQDKIVHRFSGFDHQAFKNIRSLDIELCEDIEFNLISNLKKMKLLDDLCIRTNIGKWYGPLVYVNALEENVLKLKLKNFKFVHLFKTNVYGEYCDIMKYVESLCDTKVLNKLTIHVLALKYFSIEINLPNLQTLDTWSGVWFEYVLPQLSTLKMEIDYISFDEKFLSENLPNLKCLEASYLGKDIDIRNNLVFPNLEKLSFKNLVFIPLYVFDQAVYKNSLKELNVNGVINFQSSNLNSVCSNFSNLECLNIQNTMSTESIGQIPIYLSKLKTLYIGNTSLIEDGYFMDVQAVTDEIVCLFSSMNSLEKLYVADDNVQGRVITKNTEWPNIQFLDLSECKNLDPKFIHQGNYNRKKQQKKPICVNYAEPYEEDFDIFCL
jgi:hypothetical protein